MKTIFLLATLMMLCATTLFAQGGGPAVAPAVISEVKLYDLENGYAVVEVRVSGPGAESATSGSVVASGPSIPGGSATATLSGGRAAVTPGGGVILAAAFPYVRSSSGSEAVDLDITIYAANIIIGSKTKKEASGKHYTW